MRSIPLPTLTGVAWALLVVVASAGWFATATALARRWALHDAAPGIGVIAAVIVAVTLWRWARSDREQLALAELRCPRCATVLRSWHEHARAGALADGLQQWQCDRCGYAHAEALTCERCAA
jgi:ribosomal protein S27AE